MAFDDPVAVTGLQISALEWRRMQAAQLVHHDDPLSATPGVLYGYSVSVSTLTLTLGPGSAVISSPTGANGSYLAVNNAAMTWPVTAQDATYARIDRVVLRLYDNEVDAGGQNKAALEIITGTPAASPVAPALPAGRLEIAQLQVPKSGSGSITVVDRRFYTAAAGGVVTAASYATLPAGSFLRVGQRGFTLDYLVPWRWNGTAWVVDGVPQLASTAARDAAIPAPVVGTRVVIGQRTASTDTLWEYLHDGNQWTVQTSPWQTVTLKSGFTAATPSPVVRALGGLVIIQGVFTGSMTATNYTDIASVPAFLVPKAAYVARMCANVGSPGQFLYAYVRNDTTITGVSSMTASGPFDLSGLSGYSAV